MISKTMTKVMPVRRHRRQKNGLSQVDIVGVRSLTERLCGLGANECVEIVLALTSVSNLTECFERTNQTNQKLNQNEDLQH